MVTFKAVITRLLSISFYYIIWLVVPYNLYYSIINSFSLGEDFYAKTDKRAWFQEVIVMSPENETGLGRKLPQCLPEFHR